ncbi:MAG: GNAT family N-acetyltransferase [Anaerolineae bacterium]|nr:GNAT family N-acetyltransferase [Anaerolineae bacterium]
MTEMFRVVNSTLDMAEQLEAIQRASFPTLSEEEIMTAAHYAVQIKRFPEGQFAILNQAGLAVACSTDFRTQVDFDHFEHRYIDAVDHNWLGNHDPVGDWLYGADIGVLPEYRRQGLATMLYRARHDLVRHLNLRGHVAGGMLKGYSKFKDEMPVEDYVARVVAGEIFDPTLSIQLKRGFKVHGIIQNYVDDPSCDGKAAFIVWYNSDYREA